MNLKQFKAEYRFKCDDTWGDAMESWFECAGWLYWNGEVLPTNWKYSPGMDGDGRDPESYWYDLFAGCTTEELWTIGNFLFRYCTYLESRGVSY